MTYQLIFVALFLFISCNASVSQKESVSVSQDNFTDDNKSNSLIIFEGTLTTNSPHDGVECGISLTHQIAKYRINKVIKGKHQANEIIVDHPACDGNVFKDIPKGSRVKITVMQHKHYNVITHYSGIREDNEKPKVFYVAEGLPQKIE